MDPISAIGTVAASVQFADVAIRGALKTVQLLRELQGIPGRIKKLLSDADNSIARLVQIQQSLSQSSDSPFNLLSAAQFAALAFSLDDGLQATASLQGLLAPLVHAHNLQSGRRRLWTAVVSKKLWPEIEEYLQCIQRQNDDILRELQLSGLDMQFWIADNLIKTLAIVEESRLVEEARLGKLQTLTEEVYQETAGTNLKLSQIQLCNTSTVAKLSSVKVDIAELDSKISTMSIATDNMKSQVQSLHDTILSNKDDYASQISATRQEIIETLMPLMLGQQSSLSDLHQQIERLSERSKERLGTDLRRELITHPSSLRDACDFTTRQVKRIMTEPRAHGLCNCHSRRRTNIDVGFLSFRYQHQIIHLADCPNRLPQSSSRKLHLAIQLLPFLNKTVELTFGATIQGGGLQVESPLRIFGTVRRLESPLFQLFENFPDRCRAHPTGSQWLNHSWKITRNGKMEQMFYCYTWDLAIVKPELLQLVHSLSEMRDRQPISLHDRDETGHTILHETMMLIGLLAPVYSKVTGEIDLLLDLVEQSHIDVNAKANNTSNLRTHWPVQVVGRNQFKSLENYTASDLARDFVRMFHQHLGDFSFLSRITSLGSAEYTNDMLYEADPDRVGLPLNMRSSLLSMLNQEPWLVKYLYDDPLPGILLGRRLDDLEAILPGINLSQEYPWKVPLSALELAVGWPDGLKRLSSAWTHGIAPAIGLASNLYEWESLRVLCDFPMPLFKDIFELRDFVADLLRNGAILVDGLKKRREELGLLAYEYLSTNDQLQLGLTNMGILDNQARNVYDLLKSRDIPVPASLDPGPSGSIYNFIAAVYADPALEFPSINSVLLLDHLHSLGFWDIDKRNPYPAGFKDLQYGYVNPAEVADPPAYTPLEDILSRTRMKNAHWATMTVWFLRMGARSTWEPRRDVSNILFGVAESLSRYTEENFVKYHDEKPIRLLVQYSASLYSPLETDGCDCFCSSSGCLPLHHVLRNTEYSTQYRCHLHQGYRMWYWMDACGIAEDDQEMCLEEAVRYELFSRLDMAHTCCLGPRSLSAVERRRIQEESAEEKAQLDLLMKAYRGSRDNRERWPGNPALLSACECPADEMTWNKLYYRIGDLFYHWSSWWSKAKYILPIDLTLVAWPDVMVNRDRFWDFQYRRLRQQGYEGMDFLEVIKQHFEQELSLEVSPRFQEGKATFVPQDRRELLDGALIHACINADVEPWDWLVDSWNERAGLEHGDEDEGPSHSG